ncbi:MAG TPA: AMP-binding protein [Polyangiaceae bacterium]|jgi:O-succinylbenzoic acid--CoA ligase
MTFSIFDAAAEQPHAEALTFGEERLTYQALAERVAGRVLEFQALSIDANDSAPVALVCDLSSSCFEWLYALLALGVPILPLHPRLTAPERQRLIEQARARVVLEPAPQRTAARRLPGRLPVVADDALLACVPSSGTSGSPKLVRLTHGAFLASACADSENIGQLPSDRALLCLPLSHVGGLSIVTRALRARRPIVVFAPAAGGLLGSLSALAECVTRERISLLSLVPTVLERLMQSEPDWQPPASLRAVLLGGAACSPKLYDLARDRRVPVLPSYGLTESASQVVTHRYPARARSAVRSGVVSSGFPLRGVELRIQGDQIELRGPMLCSGYVGEASPFDARGWFKTRDRGEFDPEQGLYVLGRSSELIITGGENVDPVEVEHALGAFPGVEAACVFGVDDATFGQIVALVLESDDPTSLVPSSLVSFLEERLASFKLPRLWTAVAHLPRLSSGKLDRAGARKLAEPSLRPISRGV